MKKIKIKRQWLRLWGPSEIHGPFLGSPGPGPIYRLNPPLIGPVENNKFTLDKSESISETITIGKRETDLSAMV